MSLRAYLVDDEPLSIERLSRLLAATGRVDIVGSATLPEQAVEFLTTHTPDILFLDIQMPGMSGFDLLARLPSQPVVIFTTAYDKYALKAFEVNSVDYLLKPVDPRQLERALGKAERLCSTLGAARDLRKLFENVAASLTPRPPEYPRRIASRVGERVCFVDLARVTHFYAEDKLTYAVADGRSYCVDHAIADLEKRLDPRQFIRIHRATLLNAEWAGEVAPGIGGGLLVRLKDARRTELVVARNRAAEVKTRLGL